MVSAATRSASRGRPSSAGLGRAGVGGGDSAKEEEGEGLRFGDSVTLFAEKMFGFLQGASSSPEDEDDDENSVFVRSLEHRHRPTGRCCCLCVCAYECCVCVLCVCISEREKERGKPDVLASLMRASRATGVLDAELFQLFTPHDYEAQEQVFIFFFMRHILSKYAVACHKKPL